MSDLVTINTPLAPYPLYCRSNSTDPRVFRQIFIEREYAPLDDLTDVSFIIDLGANVGYSTAYFLARFPQACSLAVEPDPGNFEILRRNLGPFGSRAVPIQAGVWSHLCHLGLVDSTTGAGQEWGRQVQEVPPEHPGAILGLDLGTLLAMANFRRISILKVDIEGAEGVIFGDIGPLWLPWVDNIAVELHDYTHFGKCSEIFQRSIAQENFVLSRSGELTICKRPRPAAASSSMRAQ